MSRRTLDDRGSKSTGLHLPSLKPDDPMYPFMREIAGMMAEGLPVNRQRPVRPLVLRPEGYFEERGRTGNEVALTEREFKEGLGRLIQVASESGWPVHVFQYKWEQGEPIIRFGYMIEEVEPRRPDAVVRRSSHKMLQYEKLGHTAVGSFAHQYGGRSRAA